MQKGEHQVKIATPGGSLAIETELDPSLTKADALSGGVASLENSLPEITEKIMAAPPIDGVPFLKPCSG